MRIEDRGSGARSRRDRLWLLLTPAFVFLLLFYVVPLFGVLYMSFVDENGFTTAHYVAAVSSTTHFRILANTLWLGAVVTLACLILGYPVAFLLANVSPRARNLLMIAIVLPYFSSILVRSYAWLVLLGRNGIINEALKSAQVISTPLKMIYNTPGVVISMVHILLPTMIFALYSVMQQVNWSLGNTSSSLGASRLQTFFRIYLPLTAPGIGAGCALVFIFSVGFYITPALVGGLGDTILPMYIAAQIVELLNWNFASALSVLLLVVTVGLFIVLNRIFRLDRLWAHSSPDIGADRSHRAEGRQWTRLSGAGSFVLNAIDHLVQRIGSALRPMRFGRSRRQGNSPSLYLFCGVVLAFLLVPILIIFPVSFTSSLYLQFPPKGFSLRWYGELWETAFWRESFLLSLALGVVTTALALPMGFLAAFGIVRSRARGLGYCYVFLITPLIVPVIVLAVSLYASLTPLGLVGSFWGLVIGHLIGSCPLVVVIMVASLRGFDKSLEQAAMSLGASPRRALRDITLPILAPAIAIAGFFAFMHSFDEVVVASFLGSVSAETLPKKMWESVRLEIKPHLAAISSLLIVATGLILLAITSLQRKSQSWGHR